MSNFIWERIKKFHEDREYPKLLGATLIFKAIVDSPIFSSLIKAWNLQPIFHEQSFEEALMTFTFGSIALGIHYIYKQLIKQETSLHEVLNISKTILPKIKTLQDKKKEFSLVSKSILDEQQEVLNKMSRGLISVQIELFGIIQELLMDTFKERMDAVSYDDIGFWETSLDNSLRISSPDSPSAALVNQGNPSLINKFDSLGLDYHNRILVRRNLNNTVVTRIFILKREDVENNPERVAKILIQHYSDEIGFAVVFEDNLSPEVIDWFGRGDLTISKPRKDFAVFDNDKALSFFGKNSSGNRFEAILNIDDWKKLVDLQREVHQTLLCAAILGDGRFYRSMFNRNLEIGKRSIKIKPFYKTSEYKEICKIISHIRKNTEYQDNIDAIKDHQVNGDSIIKVKLDAQRELDIKIGEIFSVPVTLQDLESPDNLKIVTEKLKKAIEISYRARTPVMPISYHKKMD